MNWKLFFINLVLFTILILVFKPFVSELLGFYPGDFLFAIALVIVSLVKPKFEIYVCLFVLGILRGMESFVPGVIYGFYFLLTGNIWDQLEKYFKMEGFKLKCILWSVNIALFLIFNLIIWGCRLDIKPDWFLFLNKSVKVLFYFVTTLFWTLVFYLIFKKWIVGKEEYS
jgi:hypothetical protein